MKNILAILSIIILACVCQAIPNNNSDLEVLPTMSSQSDSANRLWVGTFQLAWNDLTDGIVKKEINFNGGNPQAVIELNKRDFSANELSENSYYKIYGATSPKLKKTIEKGIKKKFNEKSDILNSADWKAGKGKYTVYAMLKKDFKFISPFDKLQIETFGNSKDKVQYFGIDRNSNSKLYKGVEILFYNSDKDFGAKLITKGNDIVYLYRTDDDKTFEEFYSDMMNKKDEYKLTSSFLKGDELKVPDIKLYQEKSFNELCNKQILGTNIMISQALETVDFKMNNEGVKLKSEAIISTMATALKPDDLRVPRKLYFNDTFVLFLQENNKTKPYFALRVNDISKIGK